MISREIRKKGFTLVELLAVIVILAIILAIAVPGISSVINNSTKVAFASNAKLVIKAIDYKKLEDDNFDVTSVTESAIQSLLNLSNTNYSSLSVGIVNNKIYLKIVGQGKWEGLTACGNRTNMQVYTSGSETCESLSETSDYVASKGVNKPKLAAGMIPVKWSTDHWVTTTESDVNWYSYTTADKQWANVIQVTNPSSYTTSGTTVSMTDVIAMWVWIPRYIYTISNGWHCNGMACDGSANAAGTIDVQFSMGTDDTREGTVTLDIGTTSNASKNKWTNEPAFSLGTVELTGIWVAKFEASGTTGTIDFKPNVSSLRSVTVGDMFTAVRNMETNNRYGWGTTGNGLDTHMMKNVEWGAVAYLAQSTYGKNTEIWINNSSTYITGCAGGSVSASAYSGCQYAYNTSNGQQASTTGNIYGIYDMSGGSREYTASYVNNGNASLTTYGNSIVTADSKYKDIYVVGSPDDQEMNYINTLGNKGDAVYETSTYLSSSEIFPWYDDYSYMPNLNQPWFTRGNRYGNGVEAGTFNFYYASGSASTSISARAVVALAD